MVSVNWLGIRDGVLVRLRPAGLRAEPDDRSREGDVPGAAARRGDRSVFRPHAGPDRPRESRMPAGQLPCTTGGRPGAAVGKVPGLGDQVQPAESRQPGEGRGGQKLKRYQGGKVPALPQERNP